ncbi:MAG: hypothetical protein WDM90_01610 [Ferruginibacter sp.]
MKIRKFIAVLLLAVCVTVASPLQTYASATKVTTTVGDPAKDAKTLSEITARVAEIQAMDKTNLTTSEKKALRKELTAMKNKADGLSRGVYISVGAVIIIILLLILILR